MGHDKLIKEHIWQPEIDEMNQRMKNAEKLGGKEGVDRQHQKGSFTARERIDLLLDTGTFDEIGAFTANATYSDDGDLINTTPKNLIIGKGKLNEETAIVSADDFTVRGGSSETASPTKMIFAENHALEIRKPMIRLVDAAGGSIKLLEQNQATKIPGYPQWKYVEQLATIPVVGAALGPCAGLGAVKVGLTHFSVMVKEKSQVFAGGPMVVNPGVNESVTKEELGGYKVHVYESGLINNVAEDEEDALGQIKRFLSYLPSNVYEVPPYVEPEDMSDRREEKLASIVPREKRRVYNMRKILELVFDNDSLFEIAKYYGRSEITMLGRINGYPIGIIANDPMHFGGALTADSGAKMTRFIDICDTFNIPIVNFVDQPGTVVGSAAEKKGTVGQSVRAFMTMNQVKVPWKTFFIRRSFGLAGNAWGPESRYSVRHAWPSAYWGSIPIEGGVEAAYKRDIENASDPEARRHELIEYYRKYENPLRTAERFGIEQMIDPRDTRPILCRWIEEAYESLPEILGQKGRTFRV